MEIFQSVALKAVLLVLALPANSGFSGQEHGFSSSWEASALNGLAAVGINFERASLAIGDAIYSSQWFGALCVVLALVAAVGVLWLRFVGAQKREKELRDLVAQKTEDLQKANEELFFLSFTDPLTGLCNRRLFDKSMEKECARIQRMNSYGSLLSIDVDRFKLLNDSEGHQKGDQYLVALGDVLTRMCRRKLDMAARCGGEEFAMILPITNSSDAALIADKVRQAIADLKLPHPASDIADCLTVSIGVATASRDWRCTPDELVAAADRALYTAKNTGRNRVCVAPDKPDAERVATPASPEPLKE